MNNINKILSEMRKVTENPKIVVKDFKKNTGNKVVGCFPVYCPEEIIHAGGMLPIGLWGGQVEIDLAKTQLPAFACSIMQSCLELGLKGVYDDLSAVIIPSLCDTLKCIGENWKAKIPNIKFISLVHPQNRKIEAGIKYLKSEYLNIKKQLESIIEREITEEDLNKSIEVYNEHRMIMREFTKTCNEHTDIITPKNRHLVIKSAFFMRKENHTELVKKLINELKNRPITKCKNKKVVLTGILAEPNKLLDLIEENNLSVVGDNLAQESRQFRFDVPDGGDALERLAKMWSNIEGCSLAFDPDKRHGDLLMHLVKENHADGVVVCMMKFCDPEEFDYPIYKQQLEKENIPMLYIEIDQQMENNEQARTRIQAFSEMLRL
ncbi:phenyllactate dehydratase [Clostridium botulinum]|uniref:Phenyllactate dehydratase n=1 Tax=Clostridium botulinum C/D str. DC5 TaxID=1443128 RepID=A0A0A0IC19_CLOBO|nr:2-hydroxyacyl-CoA dehydratase family protein [Clostridium botulinum]KEI01673.1 phenyllactate dehydratase [Clostridium botulinum C/D str. BKT75002]KEI09919.1 phenyllactate dehydratase [Clostridium botulinum C/D str. BKT2873]KGM94478.1 phenyllactate dehydratase [Clostridium botulinum D str. CCUG 7971]KGM97110.1 phenyllactate dehydratase [Clostridium botulinum C/D str. DC5]KOC48069.1 phenyllactate dehydratase [Clostridium botulinum]